MATETAEGLRYASVPYIRAALGELTTAQVGDPVAFEARVRAHVEGQMSSREKFTDPANQNLHMVDFYWGHDHDFGTFQVSGLMGTRHVWMLSRFFDHLGVRLNDVADADILDVGCWTGGASLVLAKLGARVTAIDEIAKYTDILAFLSQSFGLRNLRTEACSVYELDQRWAARFDIALCLGVLYHLSDPIIGLRRLYHALRPEGRLLVETMAIDHADNICEYQGPSRRNGLFGWNWFIPSPRALAQWLEDAGFAVEYVGNGLQTFAVTDVNDPMGPNRCFAVARKRTNHVMCQAGLSVAIA